MSTERAVSAWPQTMVLGVFDDSERVIAAVSLAGVVTEPDHVVCAIERALALVASYRRMGDAVHTVAITTGDTGNPDTEYATVYEEVAGVVLRDYRRGDTFHWEALGPWPCYRDGTPYRYA